MRESLLREFEWSLSTNLYRCRAGRMRQHQPHQSQPYQGISIYIQRNINHIRISEESYKSISHIHIRQPPPAPPPALPPRRRFGRAETPRFPNPRSHVPLVFKNPCRSIRRDPSREPLPFADTGGILKTPKNFPFRTAGGGGSSRSL